MRYERCLVIQESRHIKRAGSGSCYKYLGYSKVGTMYVGT